MKHIMAAVDGTDPSYRALELAAKLAMKFDVELCIIIAHETVTGRKDAYAIVDKGEIDRIQTRVKQAIVAAGSPKSDCFVKKSRNAAYTILEAAIDMDIDFIVMGASGKGGFKTLTLGAVSQEVVNKSACPVTIVH